MGTGSHILWYKHPATECVEALPLGNGFLGGMVFGDPENEQVYLNLDTLWSGYAHGYKVENKVDKFHKARELALEGKYQESKHFIQQNLTGGDCEWYLQMGVLKISSQDSICPKEFRRELDIATALSKVNCKANDTVYLNEAFISNPDKVMVYRFTADGKKKLNFKLMIDCELKNEVETDGDTYILRGICPTHIDDDGIIYEDGDKQGVKFCCIVKIVTDGIIKANKNHLCVSEAAKADIILTAESNFEKWNKLTSKSEKDYEAICNERIKNAVKLGFDELKERHIADHKKYYDRVSINLGKSRKAGTPTDRRLHEFMHNKENDNDLYCLLFNYGRYLTIAGSREGSQAMNLQGIWTFKMCSPWRSNYTVNINTEMNYWPTMTCSLPEMNKPLIEFITELAESGKEVAAQYYGVRGTCAHHNVDLWRMPIPSMGSAVWSFWSMSVAWFCRHLYEQYEYSLDEKYLKETAVPIMKEAARFCLDMLVDDGEGYLIFAPSTSPENEFKIGSEDCSVSKTTYMTMEIIRDLFLNLTKSAEILGDDDEIIAEIKETYPKLLPFRIGSKGQLLEWYDDVKGFDPHHRHVSHLYALHPAHLIDYDETPELIEAAKRTLEIRGDGGTGWSLGWKINFWARLRDKDKVLTLIDNQLRYIKPTTAKKNYGPSGGGTYPNMFDAHPPFQIDGNFGATSGIAQALMQSKGNTIIILPALPDKWSDGYVHGLTARGNVKVDIDWENGKLTKLTLDGKGEFNVIYGKQKIAVKLDGKKDVAF